MTPKLFISHIQSLDMYKSIVSMFLLSSASIVLNHSNDFSQELTIGISKTYILLWYDTMVSHKCLHIYDVKVEANIDCRYDVVIM